jgi:hypothetical protein
VAGSFAIDSIRTTDPRADIGFMAACDPQIANHLGCRWGTKQRRADAKQPQLDRYDRVRVHCGRRSFLLPVCFVSSCYHN